MAALTGPVSGGAAAATPALPDLVADAPGSSAPPQVYTDASGSRLLLRFDGFVHNAGAGALELRGSAPSGDQMSVVEQRIYDVDGGSLDAVHDPAAVIRFEPADGHNHWHLRHAAAYSLWNEARSAQVGAANKVGFCLVDSSHVDPHGPAAKVYTTGTNGFCRQGAPDAQDVFMGVSPGWRDRYSQYLPYQWVDISDVVPGRYWLRSTVDPDGVITEANEVNPATFGATQSVVNGYNANSFSRRVGTLFTSSVPLQSTVFDDTHSGGPGTRQYRIDVPPSNGRLNQPTGVWFSASSVTYTPRLWFSGQDSFRFSARDASSAFPLHPVSATASLGVGVNPAAAAPARRYAKAAGSTAPAPDVDIAPATAGVVGEPVVTQHGSWVLVSAVAERAGTVRMTATLDGVTLGSCRARVPAGATATCRFDQPQADGHVHHHGAYAAGSLGASVTHEAGGRIVIRRASH